MSRCIAAAVNKLINKLAGFVIEVDQLRLLSL